MDLAMNGLFVVILRFRVSFVRSVRLGSMSRVMTSFLQLVSVGILRYDVSSTNRQDGGKVLCSPYGAALAASSRAVPQRNAQSSRKKRRKTLIIAMAAAQGLIWELNMHRQGEIETLT